MNGFRISPAIVAALASLALTAAAQGTTTSDPKKTPKAEETKDQPKKAVTNAPAKAPAKSPADKKAPPKKAAPKKKVDPKVQTTAGGGTVQKYEAGKAPDLKDAKGNTVPSSPDAYDIGSATKKK
jgi:FKBP-type peptidyl-prolyl cis-trans isomerase